MKAHRNANATEPVKRHTAAPSASAGDLRPEAAAQLARQAMADGSARAYLLSTVQAMQAAHIADREPSKSGPAEGVVQRVIVITPDRYATGLNTTLDALDAQQLWHYLYIAVVDEYNFAMSMVRDDNMITGLKSRHKVAFDKTQPLAERLKATVQLVRLINVVLNKFAKTDQPDYTAPGVATSITWPNHRTRYATEPEAGYRHTSLNTGKSELTKWGSDEAMYKTFGKEAGEEGITGKDAVRLKAAGKDELPLSFLSWQQAVRLLPRPLINLMFDVRFQLDQGTVVDERTPYERGRKVVSPNAPGTLRSWHQDSSGLLPANNFDKANLPPHATALHQHYNTHSQSGAGSSIKTPATSASGFAEYTGTGSDWEHNTKIVVDYINKKVYLTLTHYQFWALVKNKDQWVFWPSKTQTLSVAQGDLVEKYPGLEAHMMSPWMEIEMPGGGQKPKAPRHSSEPGKPTPPATPAGLHSERWTAFAGLLDQVPRVVEEPIPNVERQPEEQNFANQYADEMAEVNQSAALSKPMAKPDEFDEAAFTITDYGGGGDCLFHSLEERTLTEEELLVLRQRVAAQRLGMPENASLNANQVVGALSQHPSTMDEVRALMTGRHQISNQVYASMQAIPGMYAGEDELIQWCALTGQTVAVVDVNGSLATFSAGGRVPVPYTALTRNEAVRQTLQNTNIALFKTANHYRRITGARDEGHSQALEIVPGTPETSLLQMSDTLRQAFLTLHLAPGDFDGVRAQYKKLSLQYHPDRHANREASVIEHVTRIFQALNNANELLVRVDDNDQVKEQVTLMLQNKQNQ